MMKSKLVPLALALAAATAAPAFAQDGRGDRGERRERAEQSRDDDGDRERSRRVDRNASAREAARVAPPPAPVAQRQRNGRDTRPAWERNGWDRDDDRRYAGRDFNDRRDGRDGRHDRDRDRDGRHDRDRDGRHDRDRRHDDDRRYAGRDYDRRRDRRHDDRWDGRYWDNYRNYRRWDARHNRWHAHQRYRAPRYVYPYGYRSYSWQVGHRLPRGYYLEPYYVDYRYYHLPPPPYGHRWVRVDGDVFLVAIATGLIRDVLYDLFY